MDRDRLLLPGSSNPPQDPAVDFVGINLAKDIDIINLEGVNFIMLQLDDHLLVIANPFISVWGNQGHHVYFPSKQSTGGFYRIINDAHKDELWSYSANIFFNLAG